MKLAEFGEGLMQFANWETDAFVAYVNNQPGASGRGRKRAARGSQEDEPDAKAPKSTNKSPLDNSQDDMPDANPGVE